MVWLIDSFLKLLKGIEHEKTLKINTEKFAIFFPCDYPTTTGHVLFFYVF